jgi:16S rRNA (cytosine1402-N4)-methyltransferase
MDTHGHAPVLLKESVEYLTEGKYQGIFVDATLGGGGTSERILEMVNSTGKVIGIDQDPGAIELSQKRLTNYPNFTAVCGNFRALDRILKDAEVAEIDGIIFDLGVSSMQLDDPSRGFSFRWDSELNMRMDCDGAGVTAKELLNSLDRESLKRLFYKYGEDRWAGRIASKIAEKRSSSAIETTAQLAKLIEMAIPRKFHPRRIHPATRFFQALRIAVNDELGCLEEALEKAAGLLKRGGRIVVISYHSLEDRIVKQTFRRMSDEEGTLKRITRKPIIPSQEEIEINPRARSAKMRVAEKM